MRCILLPKRRLAVLGVAVFAVVLLLAGVIWRSGGYEGAPAVRRSAAPAPAGEKTAAAPLPPPEREEAKPDDFFVEYRIEREQARGRRVELLRGIMADPNAGAEAKRTAQEQLLAIAREMDTEVRLENLLRAKGFADAVVIAEGDRITVVVPGEITPEQNASIITLVGRGADVLPENVMVIAHEG